MKENEQIVEQSFSEKQVNILEATEKLFAEKGFEGTSVRDIAQAAGVNVAMISYYFGSKEQLLEAIFTYRISVGRLFLEHLIGDTTLDPLQKLDRVVDNFVERIFTHQYFHKIMLQSQLAPSINKVAGKMTEVKLRNLELVKKLIGEGQRKGFFNKSVVPAFLMATILGTIYQFIANKNFYRTVLNAVDTSEEAFNKMLMKKLKEHLKIIFKAALTYEA